tara:strand:- start:370 stop:645 length:276 start_codon:yes stop_codon:yes gene_type:complete
LEINMTYERLCDGQVDLETENHGKIKVSYEADSLCMATICFGNSFTLRLNETNIDELRDILYDASRKLAEIRSNRLDDLVLEAQAHEFRRG